MILIIAVSAALLAGFLAGFVCFKKTNEFCGRCGITRRCPVCPEPPAAIPSRIPWRTTASSAPLRGPRRSASAA